MADQFEEGFAIVGTRHCAWRVLQDFNARLARNEHDLCNRNERVTIKGARQTLTVAAIAIQICDHGQRYALRRVRRVPVFVRHASRIDRIKPASRDCIEREDDRTK